MRSFHGFRTSGFRVMLPDWEAGRRAARIEGSRPRRSWRRPMTCPFPGMDPYIEVMGLWEGFHAPLITNCSQLLNQHLPEGYVSQIETRVRMLSIELPPGNRVPD